MKNRLLPSRWAFIPITRAAKVLNEMWLRSFIYAMFYFLIVYLHIVNNR